MVPTSLGPHRDRVFLSRLRRDYRFPVWRERMGCANIRFNRIRRQTIDQSTDYAPSIVHGRVRASEARIGRSRAGGCITDRQTMTAVASILSWDIKGLLR